MNKNKIFIDKSVKIHGNKYDYTKVNYINNTTPVLIGYDNAFYEITPANHLKGSKIERKKNKYDLKKFIDSCNEIHNFKYDYSKIILGILKNKVTITCRKHGDFNQVAIEHLNGHGCSKCGKESMSIKIRIKSEELKKSIYEKYGNKFQYLNIDSEITNETILKIICPIHGYYEKLVKNHIKYNCSDCSYESITSEKKFSKVEIINKFIKKWNNRYDYSKFEYIGYNIKSIITCSVHGYFLQTPQIHLKSGCSDCGYDYLSKIRRSTIDEFIKKSKIIHGDYYDYSKSIYKNSRTNILIICPIHGEFMQKAGTHLMGNGCKMCGESKGEKLIRIFMESNKIVFFREKTFEDCVNILPLPFDFYLPKYNLAIEFDGIQHYKPIDFFGGEEAFKKLKNNDTLKSKYCKSNNIKLLRISYKDINITYDILKNELNL